MNTQFLHTTPSNSHSDRLRRRAAGSIVAILAITAAWFGLGTSSPVAASDTQITVWDAFDIARENEFWSPPLNQPESYESPLDFAGGAAYLRMNVTSKPSQIPMIAAVCFWQHGGENEPLKYETCAPTVKSPITTPGVYYLDLGSPSSWWVKPESSEKNAPRIFDWSKPVDVGRIMMKDPVTNSLFMSRWCGAACYSGEEDLDDHLPVRIDSQLVFVADGATFVEPEGWRDGSPPGPTTAPTTTEPPVTDPPVTDPPPTDPPVTDPPPTDPPVTDPPPTTAPPTTAPPTTTTTLPPQEVDPIESITIGVPASGTQTADRLDFRVAVAPPT